MTADDRRQTTDGSEEKSSPQRTQRNAEKKKANKFVVSAEVANLLTRVRQSLEEAQVAAQEALDELREVLADEDDSPAIIQRMGALVDSIESAEFDLDDVMETCEPEKQSAESAKSADSPEGGECDE